MLDENPSPRSPIGRPSEEVAESPECVRAYVALGSNLGDRLAILQSALEMLAARADVEIHAVSRLYETRAIGAAQGTFYNAVVALDTNLDGDHALQVLHEIERAHGRERRVRWGDRTLDLDLLWHAKPAAPTHGGEESRIRAKLPHPELTARDFVLAPLGELAPELMIDGRTCRQWLEGLPPASRSILGIVGQAGWNRRS